MGEEPVGCVEAAGPTSATPSVVSGQWSVVWFRTQSPQMVVGVRAAIL